MNRTPELLAALRAEIESAPSAELPAVIGQIIALAADGFVRIGRLRQSDGGEAGASDPQDGGDRLIDVDAAAAMLGMSSRWVRDHQGELPRVNLPGNAVRFSSKRLASFIKKRSYG